MRKFNTQKRVFFLIINTAVTISAVFILSQSASKATTMSLRERKPRDAEFSGHSIDKNLVEKLKRPFAGFINAHARGCVPALVAGIVSNGRLIMSHGVNADENTKFGIASLTKTFTAVLILRLAEDGVLKLDDHVAGYLPVVIERECLKSRPVTVRDLLAHASGMPAFASRYICYKFGGTSISLPEQVHPAGYCYAYSNEGYQLLKHIIEAATQKSYAENLREKIFLPLEMNSSSGESSNGTGGITTNMIDLAKYTEFLMNEGSFRGRRILSKQSFDTLLEKGVELPKTSVDYYYSLSWEVISVNNKIESYYKAGRWFGEASGLHVFPSKKLAYLFICNPPEHLSDSFMGWRQGLMGYLRQVVRSLASDPALCTKWPSLSHSELKCYEGKYVNGLSGEKVVITMKGSSLYTSKYGAYMRTFTSNRFLIDSGRMLHNFVWKNNSVIGLALRDGYYELVR